MSSQSFSTIKKSTESAENFIYWFIETLKGKNWVRKLILFDVVLIAFFNPAIFPNVAAFLKIYEKPLPPLYSSFFWLLVVLIFIAAVIVTFRMKLYKAVVGFDPSERSAIKGLRPFGFDDADVFARLQRGDMLQECLNAVIDRDFRFGILFGESGCGKTSFLQAGIWPMLPKQSASHHCIYVKFTNQEPLATIRQAIKEQTPLAEVELRGMDLSDMLTKAASVEAKTLLIVLDQFEQFFVHYPRTQERDSFVQAMADWYKNHADVKAKILLSLRGDFMDHLYEFQKAMEYSLGPQDMFRLEKFTPEQATDIFQVIAERVNLTFDRSFVEEMTGKELASREDGLISPVDIQILAWVIHGHRTGVETGFNKAVYQKLGGIEGLLDKYLSRAMATILPDSLRQTTLKVLLSLVDLERNARAGVLTQDQIQKKHRDKISTENIRVAVSWLAQSKVRLITPVDRNGALGYELAHERLIPALRRLANKELSEGDNVNQLLERRVNEWLGNSCSSRYLLSWRELLRVERQRPYLSWGRLKSQKEDLLHESKKQRRLYITMIMLPLVLLILALGWLYSPAGQIWQVKKDLLELSSRVRDRFVAPTIVEAVANAGDVQKALEITQAIPGVFSDPQKATCLSIVAQAIEKMSSSKLRSELLRAAIQFTEDGITMADEKAYALNAISRAAAKVDIHKASSLIERILQILEDITEPADKAMLLSETAKTAMIVGDEVQASILLKQALEITIDPSKAEYKVMVLSTTAELTAKKEPESYRFKLLEQALATSKDIDKSYESESKARALMTVVNTSVTLRRADQVRLLLEKALQITAGMRSIEIKLRTMYGILLATKEINDAEQVNRLLGLALKIVDENPDHFFKAIALGNIAEVTKNIGQAERAVDLLELARQSAEKTTKHGKEERAFVWANIALAAAKMDESEKATALIAQALERAKDLEEAHIKTMVFLPIVEAAARNGNWRLARSVAAEMVRDADKVAALAAILKTWIEYENKELDKQK